MNYKHFLITFFILLTFSKGYSQDVNRKHSLGLYQSFTDYNVVLFDDKIFVFDSSLSQFTRIAYQKRLSRTWMLNTGLSNGFILNQTVRESFIRKAYVYGLDAALNFKLNNGRIMKENPRIAPYLTFGYRLEYVPQLSKLNEQPFLFLNQYGVGFNIKLSERSHIQLQTVLDQKLSSDFNTHLQYRVGLTQSLGRLEDKNQPKKETDDSDKDGIVDLLDKCPEIYGYKESEGCPLDSSFDIAQIDSLEQLVLNQRLELEKLQIELDEIRNAGESTSISKSREQELLLRIYNLQKSKDEEILALKKQLAGTVIIDTTGNALRDAEIIAKAKAEKEKIDGKIEDKELETREPIEVVPKQDPKTEEESAIPADKNYYVITMSSPNLSTATSWLAKMKSSYPDAVILPQPTGFYRVGVYVGKDKEKGLQTMEQVRKEGYTSVWLSIE